MFHKLPFQLMEVNASYFIMFTGLNSMWYLLKYVKSKFEKINKNPNWKNTAPVIAKVSECFRVNLWLMKTKQVFQGKPYTLISNLPCVF